jgi:hypothetical protein
MFIMLGIPDGMHRTRGSNSDDPDMRDFRIASHFAM